MPDFVLPTLTGSVSSFSKLPTYVDCRVLAATVAEDITRPAAYLYCILTPNADIWVRRGGTAAIPAADVTDGTGSILFPAGTATLIDMNGPTALASFSVICAGAAAISIEWFV